MCHLTGLCDIPKFDSKEKERERQNFQKVLLLAGKFHLFIIYLYSKCSIMMDVYKKGAFGATFIGLGNDMVFRILSNVLLKGK